MSEMTRLGVVSPTEAGYLTRPAAEWDTLLKAGSTTPNYIARLAADRVLAGKVLANWLILRTPERRWLQGLADGSVTTPDISAKDARSILDVQAESRAEQHAGPPVDYTTMSRRTEDPQAFWWRSTSFYRYLAGE